MDSIEFDGDLAQAAVKIQASFRGHMARKQAEKTRQEMENIKEADKQPKEDPDPLLDVDLKDPALENAAVKIQASFRGHMTRKTLKDGE